MPLRWREDGPEHLARVVVDLGLIAEEHHLKTRPNDRHWHLQRPGISGTVEVTWNRTNLFLLQVREGRRGKWSDEDLSRLISALNS